MNAIDAWSTKAMSDKRAVSKGLWAPIVNPSRGTPWVVWTCVRMTRKAAKEAYCEDVPPGHLRSHLSRVRFARVTITEDSP